MHAHVLHDAGLSESDDDASRYGSLRTPNTIHTNGLPRPTNTSFGIPRQQVQGLSATSPTHPVVPTTTHLDPLSPVADAPLCKPQLSVGEEHSSGHSAVVTCVMLKAA